MLANEITNHDESHANFNIGISTGGPFEMYFHATPITLKSSSSTVGKHQNVTPELMQLYDDGLKGAGQDSESDETYIMERMSLHKVTVCTQLERPVCDCKDFICLYVCAHVIVYRERICGENIINCELGELMSAKSRQPQKNILPWQDRAEIQGTYVLCMFRCMH